MTDISYSLLDIGGRKVLGFQRAEGDIVQNFPFIIDFLCSKSAEYGYARFAAENPTECVVVVLSGNMERFRTASICAELQCDWMAIQDSVAPWFTGSSLCAGIGEIETVVRSSFPNARKWIIVGQSSGAYAALLLSRRLANNVTLAFAPQTFDDRNIKSERFVFPSSFNIEVTANGIADVFEAFDAVKDRNSESQVFIVASFSEHRNPPEGFFWFDALHWSRMISFSDVKIIVSPTTVHPPLLRNTNSYISLLATISRLEFGTAEIQSHICEAVFSANIVS